MSVSYRLIPASELDASLVEAWRGIQHGDPAFRSPYFCPEFTQHVAEVRRDVHIVVIENGQRPVGFFPHQRARWGAGRPVGGPLSDYHGVIAGAQGEWDLQALMRAAGLSVWSFDHLVSNTLRFEPCVTARAASPQMALGGGYPRYARSRRESGSDYISKTEALARKLAREMGELRFARHETGGAMERLIGWKREQYRRTGIPDAFGVRWTGQLLERIAHARTASFCGECSVLRAGERIVAVHMGMRSRDVLHYWFPAYDPALARFSPGIILLLRIAEDFAAAGGGTIDLGKGEAQYKQRLSTHAVEVAEGAVELPCAIAQARRLRRSAEALAAKGGIAAALRLPLRMIRRLERSRRFR